MADAGLNILNGSMANFNLQVPEVNECNSNNLKCTETIDPNDGKSIDVSSHMGDSYPNTVVTTIAAAQTTVTFHMISGNFADIQDFVVVSGGGLKVTESGDHDVHIEIKLAKRLMSNGPRL
ncbi:MAG: hypothetical protein HRU33_01510 [Rhodobacteraceae bacterium]|nr:hypothetical protein [Paracoccaceae bacterium]